MKGMTTVVVIAALTGCAMSNSVQKLGPDTYSVTAAASPIRGGSAAAEGMALEDANKHCADMGKEILVTNTSSRNLNAVGAGSASVTFRCLAKGDRDLHRPNYQAAPKVIIEDARK